MSKKSKDIKTNAATAASSAENVHKKSKKKKSKKLEKSLDEVSQASNNALKDDGNDELESKAEETSARIAPSCNSSEPSHEKKKHKSKRKKNYDVDNACQFEDDVSGSESKHAEPTHKKKKRAKRENASSHEDDMGNQNHDDVSKELEMNKENDNIDGILDQVDTCMLKKVKQKKKRKMENVTESTKPDDVIEKKHKEVKVKDQELQKTDENENASCEAKDENIGYVEYLLQWEKNKQNWRFKKSQQIKLLRNMYDETKLSDKKFKILLKYLNELKGKCKEETLIKAREIAEKDPGEHDTEDSVSKKRTERAMKIVKLLS